MTTAQLTLAATVSDGERPLAIAAARQLSAAVSSALGSEWPVSFIQTGPDDDVASGSIRIASLVDDVLRDEAIETMTRRWAERIERWSQAGTSRILLSTLFRSVARGHGDDRVIERLRRLNMMALSLSRTTGIEIVDIDRLFAWCGARRLQTDYRCLGPSAAELGGHAIVAAIFAGGLDDVLPAHIQEKAATEHGGLLHLTTIFERRVLPL
jgi:hypothetical protein